MSPNSQKIVSFTVMSQVASTKKVNYTLSLNSDGVLKSAKGIYNFEFVNPFLITITMPASSNILDESKLTINVKNTGDLDLELTNFTIEGVSTGDLNYFAGRGLDIVRPGFYATMQKEYLKPGKDVDYYMIITPISSGKYNLSMTAFVQYAGKSTVYKINKTFVSSINGMVPIFDLSKDAVLSGSEVELYYEISNTNPSNIFNNISVNITGDFIAETLHLDKLNSVESKILLRKFIVVPFVDKDKTYRIVAITNYMTQSGEKKQVNVTKSLRVTSNGSLLTVSQKVSPIKEVYAGQDVIVEVTVKNMKDEVFEISAKDTVPAGIEKIGGLVQRNFTLKGLGSDAAYVYKLHVPIDTELTSINITTTGRVDAKNYEVSMSTYIKIKKNLTAANATIGVKGGTVAGSNDTKGIDVKNTSSKTNSSTSATAKKDTAFRRFFRSVETFFTNLFS
jgi:hypothetical protein